VTPGERPSSDRSAEALRHPKSSATLSFSGSCESRALPKPGENHRVEPILLPSSSA
jgi:hypothetical protein